MEATRLVPDFYRHVPAEDLQGRGERDLLAAVDSQIALAADRPPGRARVRVFTPTVEADGWSIGRTVVEVVTDDMPFLVDSVSAELTRLGRSIDLVIHPVLRVQRDVRGHLLDVGLELDAPGTIAESWIHIEVERVPGEDHAATEAALRKVLDDVRDAVEDWPRMRSAALFLATDLRQAPPPSVPGAEAEEAAALLEWLVDDHFTFLGYREYDLVGEGDQRWLRPVTGSGLGILRSDHDHGASPVPLTEEVLAKATEPHVLVLTSANSRSTVHRPAYLDYVGVKKFDVAGNVIGERRFLGLYAATAYSDSVREIPVLRQRAEQVLDDLDFGPRSHSGKDILQFLETYPRDQFFQVDATDIAPVALAVHQLGERRRTRVFAHRDPYGRYVSCLVYLPRDRYTTAVRLKVQEILLEAYGGATVDYSARVSESVLARLHIVVRAAPRHHVLRPDESVVAEQIARVVRSWDDDLVDLLRARMSEDDADALLAVYEGGIPESYRQEVPPDAAVKDLLLAETINEQRPMLLRLYAPESDDPTVRRLKVLRAGEPISLSQVLPVLASLGTEVLDERPYDLVRAGRQPLRIYDFGFRLPSAHVPESETLRERFEEAFLAIWEARSESDLLNGLVVSGGLTWQQVNILRCYVRYLLQTGSAFGQIHIESALLAHPAIAGRLVELFCERFDPRLQDGRAEREAAVAVAIDEALDAVVSLDDDRVLRSLAGMMRATLRTNYFRTDDDGQPLDRLAIKVDPQGIPELPLPRPRFEIWVYSPRVEAVHLRFGRIARGGIRWSDRRADFRTEILGLVKAQEVKNAVIVPVGAKGGFVPKRLPDPVLDREGWLAEGRAAYATFMRGMLDITDNRTELGIVPPPDVVRHDGDDPYLVVAADKGTATFSDLANSVAADYGFWLGDAFASGGSAGYDHKAMGITARGAWISVQRHFRELGVDTQTQDFTVVGVGDMSGDVFGNGMLLSEHIRLLAAFDHRHIFLDPDPDPATSYAERRRLFDLPRSSWADYDRSLISAGGGVFERSAKSIAITPQVRQVLGLPDGVESLVPAELLRAVLSAPVDLLWNGGIGTYVKSQTETNADVGDKANDALRVNGNDLRCRVVGEGGNLGFTQLGRVEAARHGVKLNTDAIDNSAGVDTSDHEVNIKILLDGAVRDGALAEHERNPLLESMEPEVGRLVLRDNYAQNVLLGNARAGAAALLSVHARLIADLEYRGILNRALEFLPDDEEMATRAAAGQGLTSPELAVLAAYAKIALTADLEHARLIDDPWFARFEVGYFPEPLRQRFEDRILEHPLSDAIATTVVVNDLINSGGITVVFRACEETGASPLEAVKAANAAIAIFDLPQFWRDVDALDNKAPTAAQTALHLESRRLLDRAIRWFLQTRGGTIDVSAEVARFGPDVRALTPRVPEELVGVERDRLLASIDRFQGLGAPPELSVRASAMLDAFALLDIVEIAGRAGEPAAEIMPLYFTLSERYDVDRLLNRITSLPRGDRWSALARQALRTDLYGALAGLTTGVARATSGTEVPKRVAEWERRNAEGLSRAKTTLDEITAADTADIATLSVALRVLRNLVAHGRTGA